MPSEGFALKHGLPILARVVSVAIVGVDPEYMGIKSVQATQKALARAGLRMDQIDVIELNEAFASQLLACVRELGIDASWVNIDDGAIAIGHLLVATGTRITG